MIALTLRQYWSRFGWEIAGFWLISLTNTGFLLGNAPANALSATAVLEIVALAWITIRLVLAEDGFRTSGGWRARPFPVAIRLFLPLALAGAVVFLAAAVRGIAAHRLFPDAAWFDLGTGGWLRQFGIWFAFIGLPLKLFGLLILQNVDGRTKSAAWAVLALIVVPLIATKGKDFAKARQRQNSDESGDGNPRKLAQGIQHELPGAADFLGVWYDPVPETKVPAARLLMRISLDPPSSPTGVSVRSGIASLIGARVNVNLRVLFDDPMFLGRVKQAIPVLRFADGTFATCMQQRATHLGQPLPFVRATEWRFSGDFVSPLAMPEFEGDPLILTRGLELLFFAEDLDRPWLKTDPRRYRENPQVEKEYLFMPESMKDLFAQFPWSDPTWQKTALPFLNAHATREDIPFILDQLRADTRLIDFFIGKGWTSDAMPVLRELAKDRIPMSAAAIILLAGEKDTALAADLAALALDQISGLRDLEPALRAQPGFDWPKFARDLWRRTKYSTNWLRPYAESWLPALWAAQEGDFTAFRTTAEQAASGNKEAQDQIADLIDGKHVDPIGYLRENMDRMTYDPKSRKWTR